MLAGYGVSRTCFDELEFEGKTFYGFEDYIIICSDITVINMTLRPKEERAPHLEIERSKRIEPIIE